MHILKRTIFIWFMVFYPFLAKASFDIVALSWDQFLRLNEKDRQEYSSRLGEIIAKFEKNYAKLSKTNTDFGRRPLNFFIKEAIAAGITWDVLVLAEQGMPCFSGGNLSEYEDANAHLPPPRIPKARCKPVRERNFCGFEVNSCPIGTIICSPLIYGLKEFNRPPQKSTAYCIRPQENQNCYESTNLIGYSKLAKTEEGKKWAIESENRLVEQRQDLIAIRMAILASENRDDLICFRDEWNQISKIANELCDIQVSKLKNSEALAIHNRECAGLERQMSGLYRLFDPSLKRILIEPRSTKISK